MTKIIFIAGAYGSGTTAITGALDRMGVSTAPPHFLTNDPRTPNSFESTAFRNIILSFADADTTSLDTSKSELAIEQLRHFRSQIEHPHVALKMPLASICLQQIVAALDPSLIVVHRPFEEIEASRRRRNWPSQFGADAARIIYSKIFGDIVRLDRSFLPISYNAFLRAPEHELFRILDFCKITDQSVRSRMNEALAFIRRT